MKSPAMQASNLVAGKSDPTLAQADIALGQPDPAAVIAAPRVKWVHLTSAGYDRYDRPEFREAMRARGGMLTTSSGVYDDPCAQHVLAMMLALARQLPQALDNQRGMRAWPSAELRINSFLLTGQTAVILSFGAIARRLIELLAPFKMKLYAVRRQPRGDEPIETVAESDVDRVLPLADHVVNILPGGPATRHFMNPDRFANLKPGAIFYNIGRGSSVDQSALLQALKAGRLRYAYLDVTDPEPFPADHPLWEQRNCFITPHTAGGRVDEFEALARHFVHNLRLFEQSKPLMNRVI
jgi:phosphoglycerate dehydrogenase-like enzyme